MATPREELVELVEAYAAATKADNKLLKGLMSQRLGSFLQSVDIVKPVAVPQEIQQAVEAQLPAVKTPAKKPAARRTRRTKET